MSVCVCVGVCVCVCVFVRESERERRKEETSFESRPLGKQLNDKKIEIWICCSGGAQIYLHRQTFRGV